jgi:hypothetical protein
MNSLKEGSGEGEGEKRARALSIVGIVPREMGTAAVSRNIIAWLAFAYVLPQRESQERLIKVVD